MMSSSTIEIEETFDKVETGFDVERAQLIESTIQRSSQIATLPGVAVQLIRLCEDPDSTMEQLTSVIDTVLAMRIMKLVNSAYYGMSGKVSSIQHAIILLGLKAVKNLAIAASLVKLARGGQFGPNFNADDLWTHSVAVATGTQILAQRAGYVSSDEAFLAGLIHDMGIVVEMQVSGRNFAKVIQKVTADPAMTFRSAEEDVLEASHEDFGAALCKAWNFPKRLQFAAGFHHRPWELPIEHRRLPSLVHIGDVLAVRAGLGYTRTVETDVINPELLSYMNLTESELDSILLMMPEAMVQSQELLA